MNNRFLQQISLVSLVAAIATLIGNKLALSVFFLLPFVFLLGSLLY